MIEDISGLPICFGDFDADKYTDIFMLANGGTAIHLLKGHSCVDGKTVLTFFGSRRCLSHMKQFICNFPRPVYNLVASDFTGEFHQDLLVTIKSTENTDKLRFDIILVKGNSSASEFHCSQQKILITNVLSEPFILDFNGDMISDFIVETEQCSLQLFLGGPFRNENLTDNNNPGYICLDNLSTIKHLAQPHSSGFLNLNSKLTDMTSDIFINGKDNFEYIFNIPGEGFTKKKKYNFPSVPLRGQSAFVDLNYDGHLEHLIPVCYDSESFSECEQPGLMVLDTEEGSWINVLYINQTLGDNFNRSLTFANIIHDYISLPIVLRIGDINYDGFPDFVTLLLDIKTKKTVAAIFLNKLDKSFLPNKFKRTFELDWISDYEDVLMVSLFDIFNNGRLNLLMTTKNESTKYLSLKAYDYYMEKSIYFSFLRVNVISGLYSDKSEENVYPKNLAFGSAPPGVFVCFNGPFGNEHSCSVQMSQSAHFALQLPYMIFGLGDTLNVINDFKVSIANGNESQRIRQWNEIIPGSKLVIIPYKPDLISNWELRVFINMSIYSLFAFLFLFALGLILTFAISILHFLEKIQDRVDNQQYRSAWL